jgi:hypothetical protein
MQKERKYAKCAEMIVQDSLEGRVVLEKKKIRAAVGP